MSQAFVERIPMAANSQRPRRRCSANEAPDQSHGARPWPSLSSNAICALITGASASLSTDPVRLAHAEFVAALAAQPPCPILVNADVLDLDYRADHFEAVLKAISVYLTAILNDTAQNTPGGLGVHDIEAVLADVASDVTGTLRRAADDMAGRLE